MSFIKRRIFELLGITCLLAGFFMEASLLSYCPTDPSWNLAVDAVPQNWCGAFGAVLADILIQFFGYWGIFIGIWLLFLSIQLMKKEMRSPLFVQLIFCFLSVFLFSVLFTDGTFFKSGVWGPLLWKESPLKENFLCVLFLFFCLCVSVFFTFAGRIKLSEIGSFYEKLKNIFLQKENRSGQDPSFSYPADHAVFSANLPEEALPSETPPQPLPQPDTLLNAYGPVKKAADFAAQFSLSLKKEAPKDPPLSLDAPGEYHLPPLNLLTLHQQASTAVRLSADALRQNADALKEVLSDFGIRGEILQINPGPVVTLYELQPAAGLKSSRVISLADDIARSMSAISARVAVIPGRNIIGIELPNKVRDTVHLRDLFASELYEHSSAHLTLALGKDIAGQPVIADLARMPHLLVAGTTGSGKSVGVNAMILSLIYRLPPERCKFIMIDPKMLELSVYDGIPHLLTPVVTDPKKAVVALKWTVKEMEKRYRAMAQLGVRNIENYNQKLAQAREKGENLNRKVQVGFDKQSGGPVFETQDLSLDPLPFIVVVVDEMADLMLVAGKEIEATVQRLAQMARAAGIHLIMATQRPSVDVITGTIKANFPTRISFQVTSKIDSRTILSEQGAEQLLGQGDMLYMAAGGRITRVHGPFVSDSDVDKVVQFLKKQSGPSYVDDVTLSDETGEDEKSGGTDSEQDALYAQAVEIVRRDKKASTSYIQRHLQIGYNRAARLIERMEAEGLISAANHVGKREVLH